MSEKQLAGTIPNALWRLLLGMALSNGAPMLGMSLIVSLSRGQTASPRDVALLVLIGVVFLIGAGFAIGGAVELLKMRAALARGQEPGRSDGA